jgi:predicted NBD/HSP70 family sugar kinase
MTRLAGSSKLLRAINESTALGHLLDPGHLTRSDLRKLTELSTPTISEVLRRLTEAGLVTVVGHNSGRPGPNAEVYAANPSAAYAAALSVRDNGTRVTAALCDLTGRIRARTATAIDVVHDDPGTALAGIVTALRTEADVPPDRLRHVQLGVAGSYDPRAHTVRHADIPGLGQPGLVPAIAAALGTHIGIDNDVNLAAVAERRRGTGRGKSGFALVRLGEEGLGLAIDIGGTLLRGARGGAGEIGYMPLFSPDSPQNKLDLQRIAGGPAILALGRDHGLEGTTPAEIVKAAAATAPASPDFLAQLADRIAVGLAGVVAVLDPELLVLAGPVADAGGPALLAAVQSATTRVAPLESTIVLSTITDDAVLLGALDASLTAVRESLIAAIRHTPV